MEMDDIGKYNLYILGSGVTGVLSHLYILPVLGLTMGCQRPRLQLQLTLRTPNSLQLPLPKGYIFDMKK